LSNFMAVGEGAAGNFPPSPFPLPAAYAGAWQQKMQDASNVRAAVKAVSTGQAGVQAPAAASPAMLLTERCCICTHNQSSACHIRSLSFSPPHTEAPAPCHQAELEEGKKKELMAAIQAHFKDWLQATGSMRQVYDLARAERDGADAGASGSASGSGSL
jgi:hypothetical protein